MPPSQEPFAMVRRPGYVNYVQADALLDGVLWSFLFISEHLLASIPLQCVNNRHTRMIFVINAPKKAANDIIPKNISVIGRDEIETCPEAGNVVVCLSGAEDRLKSPQSIFETFIAGLDPEGTRKKEMASWIATLLSVYDSEDENLHAPPSFAVPDTPPPTPEDKAEPDGQEPLPEIPALDQKKKPPSLREKVWWEEEDGVEGS